MLSWAKLCHLQNSYVEAITPIPHPVTVFGNRISKEVMKLK